jgi:hypothetical protein
MRCINMRNINSLLTVLALSFSSIAAVGCAAQDDVSATDDDASSVGKFDLWQSTDGWHFHLKSGNGAILLSSEAYTDRTGAINGILSVTDNGQDAGQYQVVAAKTGYMLHLVAGNNEIISFSQVYSTKSSATRAVTSCVHAATSYVDKQAANTTGARVEVEASETGFHFNLFAKNGQIVLTSEHYTTEAAAFNGAFAVQDGGTYSVLANAAGGYYFTVTALNGQVVGVSQQYSTKSAAQAAVTSTQALIKAMTIL